ncbi:unnamed protein product [Boreogadus saida]
MSARTGVGCRSLRCGKGRQAVGNGGECGEGFGYDIVSERLHAPQPASGSPEEVFSPWKPGPRWDDNKGTAPAMLNVFSMFSTAGPRLIAALITTPGLVLCECMNRGLLVWANGGWPGGPAIRTRDEEAAHWASTRGQMLASDGRGP